MNTVLYIYDTYYGLYWYDTKMMLWKEVTSLTLEKVRDKRLGKFIDCIAMKEYYEKLVFLWTDEDKFWGSKMKKVWCTMIVLEKTETEIHGEAEAFKLLDTLPGQYQLTHCVSVSD